MLLDINLLKPSRIKFVLEPVPPLTLPDGASPPKWLEYIYRTAHPALRWLPTKFAEWIGMNLQEELGFPDKADKRAQTVTSWTSAELNSILYDHVVAGELTTSILRYEHIQWMFRYVCVHTSIYLMYSIYMLRTPLQLFHLILTVLRRIVMMSPWKTVGLHVPSSSSNAVCDDDNFAS